MTDQTDATERALQRRLIARAAIATRPFDAAAIARTAITTAPPRRWTWSGALPMRASLAWVVVLTLIMAALVGGAVLAGALLRAPAPLPSALLAIGRSEGFVLANADGSGPLQVASDGPYLVPQWSADGSMVATTAVIGDEGNMLTVFAEDGSLVARVPGVEDLRWSPTAGWLAIATIANPGLQVLSLRAGQPDGAHGVLRLALPPGARRIVGFDWAPDGGRLAVGVIVGADPEAAPTLWLVPADGRPAEAVPGDGRSEASYPQWSPDGRRIAVITTDRCDIAADCPSIVRILDAASGQRLAEVENLGSPATVRWSRDGTMLAVDSPFGQREVFVYTLADNVVRRVTDTPGGRTWLLGWTPDGASLLVIREGDATGSREAWQVDVASGTRRMLADDAYGVALQPVAGPQQRDDGRSGSRLRYPAWATIPAGSGSRGARILFAS